MAAVAASGAGLAVRILWRLSKLEQEVVGAVVLLTVFRVLVYRTDECGEENAKESRE